MKPLRIVAVLVVILLLAAFYIGHRLLSPYRGFSGTVFVEIPHGTSAAGIGRMLAGKGVVRSGWDFLIARVLERGRTLQAGEYRFENAASPREVYERIARGDVFYYELTIPEGFNMFDIGAAAGHLGLFPPAEFIAAARDPSLIRDLDPRAPSLEGYLFPNTYRLKRKTTPEQLCRMMTAKFRQVWKGLGAQTGAHDAVTLASLVEKEGKLDSERPLIAAVFENRLRIGMKLDCDSTTIYAAMLDHRYRGTIYRSDLESDNSYNTYRHAGLPPGPIANPGLTSLRAVLEPAHSEALYFVLRPDGSGEHEFSTTIADHRAATVRYRRSVKR
ncbi:MAG TPA: endolytic transglycosylase MltG [Bryobacteraceae bacterium]|nr:endolytic transglycosylase MltG [Bryobacteraceae bacterium]